MKIKETLFYNNLKRCYFRMRAFLIPKRIYAHIKYYVLYHTKLSIDNPQTFDEKIWWLKLHYFNPLMTICTDKYLVRKYVEKCGLRDILNECYASFTSVDDIDIEKLPNEFFLKCNHLSGGNIICTKDNFDKEKIKKIFRPLLRNNFYYYGFEYNYKYIKPQIVIEKVLRPLDGSSLLDYKFMCFAGVPRLLFLDIGACDKDGGHSEHYYRNVYDMRFNLLEIKETRDNFLDDSIQKPKNFDYMIECAKILSKPFPHCRVDLYNVDGKVYFGEITFFHGSGYNHIEPHKADLEIGSWIPLDKSYPIKYGLEEVEKAFLKLTS